MLALALMKSPSNQENLKHLQRHAWSVMLSVNYRIPPVDSEDDHVLAGVTQHKERLLHETQPGTCLVASLVELFTWMRYISSR